MASLLQPVALGSSMRPIAAEEIRQDEPELLKAVFTGLPGTQLNVWRQGDHMGDLVSFIWEMDEYVIRGDSAVGVLQISSRKQPPRATPATKTAAPKKLPGGVHDEVRLLYRWTMYNLPKDVPGDIRSFLQGFAD